MAEELANPLLCEPYLLDPSPDGVHVVWHTEEPGTRHAVLVGPAVAGMTAEQVAAAGEAGDGWRRFTADTTPLERLREDAQSQVPGRSYAGVTRRPAHRHLATVTGLPPGRTPYAVLSIDGAGTVRVAGPYTLAPAPPPGAPVRLLLTSDHQLSPLVAANLATVDEIFGYELDGVLMAGDMVNLPDRASEWFGTEAGLAFFAGMTGRDPQTVAGRTYRGGPLAQHTPLYPAIGNHEVMGRWSESAGLAEQFHDTRPDAWDVTTYEQMFPYPRSEQGGPRWWSRTIGEVHLTCLFVTQVWRSPRPEVRGRYQEAAHDLPHPERWGHGQHLFVPIKRGSPQYEWLARTLSSEEARRARFRVVMFHHPGHGLGVNSVPPFTDPVPTVHRDPDTGEVAAVTYHYPLADDYLLRDLEPLFAASGVNLVHNGHSHLWNRFRSEAGVNWLETSNVGNSFGAFDVTSGAVRKVPDHPDYVGQGDPGGLLPVVPTEAPLAGPDGTPLPYVASNDITVFSVLDSAAAVVRSFRFDPRTPDEFPVLFDELHL